MLVAYLSLLFVWVVLTVIGGFLLVNIAYAIARFRRGADDFATTYSAFFKRHAIRSLWCGMPLVAIGMFAVAVAMDQSAEVNNFLDSLDETTKMRVRTGGHCHRNPEKEILLLETVHHEGIENLLRCIAVAPKYVKISNCRCCGDLSFEFYRDESLIASISLHHGTHLRFQGETFGDQYLTAESKRLLTEWLKKESILAQLDRRVVKEIVDSR